MIRQNANTISWVIIRYVWNACFKFSISEYQHEIILALFLWTCYFVHKEEFKKHLSLNKWCPLAKQFKVWYNVRMISRNFRNTLTRIASELLQSCFSSSHKMSNDIGLFNESMIWWCIKKRCAVNWSICRMYLSFLPFCTEFSSILPKSGVYYFLKEVKCTY